MARLELWAGPECSLNRVNDEYQDQLAFSGHRDRLSDLDLFAGLGISKMRYPVLWESMVPDANLPIDWTWADERLGRIRALGIKPIVGLVHHGSGPAYCTFESKEFPQGLADYARKVAGRYPWVEYYTPVNEPLTTARFAGLYGLWYPHHKSDAAFVRIMLNQIKGTILAMRAIRQINSKAKLVQTEDLGKAQSTPALAYQAEFENLRRWLTFDLLSGKVNRDHGLYPYLTTLGGASAKELAWFEDNALPPDIIGINHYVTSERFLDHRYRQYPEHTRGSNGTHRYSDVETVRVKEARRFGFDYLIKEAWVRYGLPLALTEVHMGCTREEQMRWFMEAWKAAEFQRNAGVDIRGVTAWSLLGAYNWNCLLTHRNGCYESGVFDLYKDEAGVKTPRPTALAAMLESLANGDAVQHPALEGKGWWGRPIRYGQHFDAPTPNSTETQTRLRHEPERKTILITGATGTLGQAFQKICRVRGLDAVITSRTQLDITRARSVEDAIRKHRPWAIINAAGYVRVAEAEQERDRCFQENALGPEHLARSCSRHGVKLVTFSSDLVFGKTSKGPFSEMDIPAPANVYGESKARAEEVVLNLLPSALVVRTSAFFGPWDEHNFVYHIMNQGYKGLETQLADDQRVSPTYVPDLVNATLDLLIDGAQGIWHLANKGSVSWLEFGQMVYRQAELDSGLLQPIATDQLALLAPRPANSTLISLKGDLMPTLESSLHQCVRELVELFPTKEAAIHL